MVGRIRSRDAGAGWMVYIYSMTAGRDGSWAEEGVSYGRWVVMALKRMQVLLVLRAVVTVALAVGGLVQKVRGGLVGASSTYLLGSGIVCFAFENRHSQARLL